MVTELNRFLRVIESQRLGSAVTCQVHWAAIRERQHLGLWRLNAWRRIVAPSLSPRSRAHVYFCLANDRSTVMESCGPYDKRSIVRTLYVIRKVDCQLSIALVCR